MNNTQALSKLRKIFGKNACAQDSKVVSSQELRDATSIKRMAAIAIKKDAQAAMEARYQAVLAADAEYQKLKADYRAAKDALQKIGQVDHYRYSAGFVSSIGDFAVFHQKAEADTLDELIQKSLATKAK